MLSPQDAARRTREICALAPVMPVLVIDDSACARPLARALVSGGLPALEVTLRTPAALDAIREMTRESGAVVGAGTLITPGDVRAAKEAGAVFGVSPGATDALLTACAECDLPLLPGAVTATEAMRLAELGHDVLKFFPAEASGGPATLKAIGGPLKGIDFCPTGGVTPENAPGYLGLGNVICVGGSWVAPAGAIRAGDWAGVETLAKQAASLRR